MMVRTAIQILDILSKILLNDALMYTAAVNPFTILIQRYSREPSVLEFTSNFVILCLSYIQDLERMESKHGPAAKALKPGGGALVPLGASKAKTRGRSLQNPYLS